MSGAKVGNEMKKALIASAMLCALVLVVYGQCGGFELVTYDDTSYVSNNQRVMQGISAENIGWAFSTFQLSNYHPLTVVSHMLDTSLFGDSDGARHLVNVFFHLCNVLLLFFFLLKATAKLDKDGLIPSFFVAALFAVHPVHVESVAWVAERKDVLSTFFWLSAMHSWLGWVRDRNMGSYGLTFFFTGLGILAKPMVVTLPAALVLLDIWPLNRVDLTKNPAAQLGKLIAEKLPLFGLSVLSSVLTVMAQHGGGAMQSAESFPLSLRISNALVSYVAYLGELVAPVNLAVFYPYPHDIPFWKPALAALFIVAVSAVAVRFIRKFPLGAVGWFWYLGTLVPVIGLVQVGDQSMADRYAYIPFMGIYMIIAFGAARLVREGRVPGKAAVAFGTAVVAVLLVGAYTQAGHWKDSKALYTRALAVTENNHHMHYNYGNLLEREKNLTEAARHFKAAFKADPSHYKAMSSLASILSRKGNPYAALDLYQRALQLNPDYAPALGNRGIVYMQQGKFEAAMADLRKASALEPQEVNHMINMGLLFYMRGDNEHAKEWLRKALQIDPDNKIARKNLALIP
ncbi:tetratricopeptide repeat protein [Desulfovibrio sp. JC010]|uniref:tetratricopeptide repeat protein n=1 Tax=Desulfovibrio sp. JC010 TaxID=2593641 RepID=UPI0013D1C6DE|nr:tetratricopeptide repeat protein [Desulfovibrio sp. JC010]NDV27785.1 tetratricopeptide repeat protein [Desulfovibrio sp. JC010]